MRPYPATTSLRSIRPELTLIVRSHRAASAGSCVTSTSVAPRSRRSANISSMMLVARRRVEIAGRLVGDQNGGVRRQRPRQRHTLLLAAGQLRRIMAKPILQPDGLKFGARREKMRRGRPPAPAEWRHSPARSWSGSDGRTGTRCRYFRRESARAHPRSRRRGCGPQPARRRNPAAPARPSTMSSVDLPDPDGPTSPTVSPRAIRNDSPLRMWTLAAPRPRLRCTSSQLNRRFIHQ